MSRNSIVVEHFDCIGTLGGKPVRAPALRTLATMLVSLGSDEILVMTPGVVERETVLESDPADSSRATTNDTNRG